MKPTPSRLHQRGFSLSELAAVVAVVAVLVIGTFLLMASRSQARVKAQRIACVGNLKCVAISFRPFAADHQEHFPMQASTNDGGSFEFVPGGEVFPHFRALSNEIAVARMLICPADRRRPAEDFPSLRDEHVSYFLNLAASETSHQVLLLGDRLMEIDGNPARGVVALTQESRVRWMSRSHRVGEGNVALADGSARRTTNALLQKQVSVPDLRGTNRLAFP